MSHQPNFVSSQKETGLSLNLDPIDWQQLYLLAKLTPGQRMQAMAQSSAFGRAMLRGAFRRRFPELTIEEINMKMFYYLQNQTEYHDE